MASAAGGFLFITLMLVAFVGILALRNRILLKMGMRNLSRRKVNTAIIISGLMIGTAIISGAMIVGDTLENMFTKGTYDTFDETDETAFALTPNFTYEFFDYSIYENTSKYVANDTVLSKIVEDISPEISIMVSALDINTRLSDATITLTGFDHGESQKFGEFYPTTGGSTTGDDLAFGEVLVNEWLAEEMEVKAGHRLLVFYGTDSYMIFKVKHVVKAEGRAGYGQFQGEGGFGIFIKLEHAQTILNVTGQINLMKISNKGDKVDGLEHSDVVAKRLTPFMNEQETPLLLRESKQEAIDGAIDGSKQLRDLFGVMGIFTIIAGIMLVINIFVMLAEERKGEMGITRAIGLKRKHLTYMYLFEGVFLAFFAALIGVVAGLLVAYAIIAGFSSIFIEEGFDFMEFFTFKADSLIFAFSAGLMITLMTIIYSSWKISKLNIIRAIRNIPEPRYQRHEVEKRKKGLVALIKYLKDLVLRNYEILLIVLGIFLMISTFTNPDEETNNQEWASYGGLSMAIIGATLLGRRWFLDEKVFTAGGIALLLLWAWPYDIFEQLFGLEMKGEMEMFVISGLFLVLAALWIVIYNNHLVLNLLLRLFGRFKSIVPVFKTAISYPMDSKFRTGMTLAMFALIIFTVTTLAMIMGLINGNIEQITEDESGGFDMIGVANPRTPFIDIETEIAANVNLSSSDFEAVVQMRTAMVSTQAIAKDTAPAQRERMLDKLGNQSFTDYEKNGTWYSLLGCDDEFFKESRYELEEFNEDKYENKKEVWQAIQANDSLAIVDFTVFPAEFGPEWEGLILELGDEILIRDPLNHTKVVKVIGITKQTSIRGIFVNSSVVSNDFGTNTSTIALFKFRDGMSDDKQLEISKDVESEFVMNGMSAFVIKKEIEDGLDMMKNFFYIMEAFLGLGLVVGIAGLGVITIRSVTERRQQIGMLRAIGFKRSMILKSFIIESSFIALLGIFIGVALGIILGYRIYLDMGTDKFTIPWMTILIVGLISYICTFLCTVGPSRKAAKVSPAEALRYLG